MSQVEQRGTSACSSQQTFPSHSLEVGQTMDDDLRRTASGRAGQAKAKMSKLEKIYQLKASNRALVEKGKRMQAEMIEMRQRLQDMEIIMMGSPCSSKRSSDASISITSHSEASADSREKTSRLDGFFDLVADVNKKAQGDAKMVEALNALKKVTVTQEKSIGALRSKLKKSKMEVASRDKMIARLENKLRSALDDGRSRDFVRKEVREELKCNRERIEDLELRCKEKDNRNTMLQLELDSSLAKNHRLLAQLDASRAGRSSEKLSRETDVEDLKEDLSQKNDRISELELELKELREKQILDEAFRDIDARRKHSGFGEGFDEDAFDAADFGKDYSFSADFHSNDFFSDEEDDDDGLWVGE